MYTFLLPPATKLGQGNIFSSVCQEFCSRGGGVPGQVPPRQVHPPGQVHPPWAGTPPGAVQAGRYGQQAGAVRILLECILVFSTSCTPPLPSLEGEVVDVIPLRRIGAECEGHTDSQNFTINIYMINDDINLPHYWFQYLNHFVCSFMPHCRTNINLVVDSFLDSGLFSLRNNGTFKRKRTWWTI